MIALRLFLILAVFWLNASVASAKTFEPVGDIIGAPSSYTVKKNDNLYAVARRQDIGIVELLAANPDSDPWTPDVGSKLAITSMHILPSGPRAGIVINLAELRLFYYPADGTVMSFPIGIGRQGWETPTGTTKIMRKREHPYWTPPASILAENPELPEIVPAGPNNPLGDFAMDLGLKSILIHGTNRPSGVGKRSSHGCIRLYPEDIRLLFAAVPLGTLVRIVDMPYKLGWQKNQLYLEVNAAQDVADQIADYHHPSQYSLPEIYASIKEAAGKGSDIDWYQVENIVARHDGIPLVIGQRR